MHLRGLQYFHCFGIYFQEQGFYLELEFLGCEIMVKNLTDKQESLQKNVVDVRFSLFFVLKRLVHVVVCRLV